jgi:hypothetical protein
MDTATGGNDASATTAICTSPDPAKPIATMTNAQTRRPAVAEEQFAVVIHSRWLETEEPKATVIRSTNGWIWHDVCVTDPGTAQDIADALMVRQEARRG